MIRRVWRFAALVLWVILAAGCSRQEAEVRAVAPDPQFGQHISWFTQGQVSRKARLGVGFIDDVIPPEQVGKSAAAVVEIEPRVRVEAVFEDQRQIAIVPQEPLQPGRTYLVRVNTARLAGFPEQLRTFEFTFRVMQQEFEVTVGSLHPAPEGGERMLLSGVLRTADQEQAEAIKGMLAAQFLGRNLPLSWEHNADGRHHDFTVSGIERQKDPTELTLQWDGRKIGVDNRGSRQIEIPARNVFKVTGVRAVQGAGRHLEVQFSDLLDPNQNLRGLVQLTSGGFSSRLEGNLLKIFPDPTPVGEVRVIIEAGVRNSQGQRLGERHAASVTFEQEKPQVRFVGKGVILPENDRLTIPFEAVGVHSVQVTAFQVYESNIGKFLQANTLDCSQEINRVGRYLWRKTIPLTGLDRGRWNRYALDAGELLRAHPGALIRLTLAIDRSNSAYECSEEDNRLPPPKAEPPRSHEDLDRTEAGGWDFAEEYFGGGHASWSDRRNPCRDAYFRHADNTRVSRNFLASNIGLIAKRGGDDRVLLAATDLRTAKPLPGVQLTLFNFQNQPVGRAVTNAQGQAEVRATSVPFHAVAEKDGQKGYLKLSSGTALPTSHFDVGGQQVEKGVKGHIYGERGVWRPGDEIFLTFVLQDREKAIPAGHPVTMELINPRGQTIQTQTNAAPLNGFYVFRLRTAETDLTGQWTARARLGGMTFERPLRIETVVPNRLKVELDFGREELTKAQMPLQGRLFAQWLHGATAARLKADVAVRLESRPTRFGRAADFVFDDPAREFQGERLVLFEGRLDDKGEARFEKALAGDAGAPGMLTAHFTSRVFEEGGDFSTATAGFPYHPYARYVGIKLPKGDQARGMLLTDTKHPLEIVTLDSRGEPAAADQVQVTLYKIDWKWWWDKSGDSLARYASASHSSRLQQATVATRDGRGTWEFEVKYPDWGRYLIRACDLQGGHCTGQVFYMDWPGWAGRAQEERGAGASMLTLYTDKARYSVGETAVVHLPPATQGRALVSVESGSAILEQRWLELAAGQETFKLPVTRAMAPNVYVNVTLLQPHAGRDNDRPIRLYGVVPLLVEDPQTRLQPRLKLAEELAPEKTATVEVAEAAGRELTYTLALVDEGLLGLTNFRTPDLHQVFYRKEALGVKTWDLFDEVVGAYGGALERLLALGGDEDGGDADKKETRRRFPPVVRFLGPFHLQAGKTARHEIPIPQYLGAVRVMVVAGHQGAYGAAEKSVPVRQPVALLSTLPRVLGPGEELQVPVAVFVMDPKVREVEVTIQADQRFEVMGPERIRIPFAAPGDQLGFFRLRVKDGLGQGRISFRAAGGGHQAQQTVDIAVRSPNLSAVRQLRGVAQPAGEWRVELTPHGLPGTNRVTLEASVMPPLNLERRLGYLIRYPHGCVEQITSAVFPQLYLPALVTLDGPARQELDRNVQAGIERLRQYQRADGAFAYWPGADGAHDWSSNYVGHFLLEAKRLGYPVPAGMLSAWSERQKAAARAWTAGGNRSTLDQAYRLYTLALAGSPEMGAMNRLRESGRLDTATRWQLAAAYRLVGLGDAARELAAGADLKVGDYERSGETLGSALRDQAILLQSLTLQEDWPRARELAERISTELSSDRWHNTQAIAWSLLAMAGYAERSGARGDLQFAWRIGSGPWQEARSSLPVWRQELTGYPPAGAEVTVANRGGAILHLTLSAAGVPRAGAETAVAEGLSLAVQWQDLEGNPLTVANLAQGRDLVALVKVRNLTERDFQNLALTQIVPSGWQIHNSRFEGGSIKAPIDYQDVRDDRLHTYFDLKARQEKTFTALFNASFLGRFYLPGWGVEAMYEGKEGRIEGQWVEVVPTGAR